MKLLVLLLLALTSPYAAAYSCFGPITICSAYAGNQIIFRGRVLDVELIPPALTTLDGQHAPIGIGGPSNARVRFEVLEVFRGTPGHELVVKAGDVYKKGSEYLIFANDYKNIGLAVNTCAHGHQLHDSVYGDDPDLVWLRAYPTAPPVASIYGTVQLKGYHEDRSAHFDATMMLSGTPGRMATTDAKNQYRFDGLPPGEYTVTASLPAGMVDDGPRKVSVEAKSCAEVDWGISYDSHIRGTVRNAAGEPAAGVPLTLMRPSNSRFGYDDVARTVSGPDGQWVFSKLDPGDYLVAVHGDTPTERNPYATVFYPASPTLAGARTLHLTASGSIDGLEMVESEHLTPVVVHARALQANGSPAANAHFTISDTQRITAEASSALSSDDGSAELHLFAGREYDLTTNKGTNDLNDPAECAGPFRFVAREGLTLGDMRFDKSFHDCRSASAKPAPAPISAP